jgi:hypothetical protein
LADGTFLIGETHEPAGSVYVGERTIHLFASRGGSSWVDVLDRPMRPGWAAGIAHMDAYFQYPDGSVPLLISGYGTVVVRVGPPFSAKLPAVRTPVSHTIGAGVATAPPVASGSGWHGLNIAITILLFATSALMVAAAAGVRKLSFDRGPVAVGPVVVQPVVLIAAALSLFVGAIVTSLIA